LSDTKPLDELILAERGRRSKHAEIEAASTTSADVNQNDRCFFARQISQYTF